MRPRRAWYSCIELRTFLAHMLLKVSHEKPKIEANVPEWVPPPEAELLSGGWSASLEDTMMLIKLARSYWRKSDGFSAPGGNFIAWHPNNDRPSPEWDVARWVEALTHWQLLNEHFNAAKSFARSSR